MLWAKKVLHVMESKQRTYQVFVGWYIKKHCKASVNDRHSNHVQTQQACETVSSSGSKPHWLESSNSKTPPSNQSISTIYSPQAHFPKPCFQGRATSAIHCEKMVSRLKWLIFHYIRYSIFYIRYHQRPTFSNAGIYPHTHNICVWIHNVVTSFKQPNLPQPC